MNKLQWNFNQYTKLFIHNNAPENILCEMVAILSKGRWLTKWTSQLLQRSAKQNFELAHYEIYN